MAEIIIIEPGRYERNYWADLWRYRELLRVLAWRDLAVRYKQTLIGAAWAIIRPVYHDDSLHGDIWPHGQAAARRYSAYALMVFARMLPLTFFFDQIERDLQQSGQ